MKPRSLACALTFAALSVTTSSASAQMTPVAAAPATTHAPISRHVIIVSIDGLRPDAIDTFEAPTLRRMIAQGGYASSALTVMPSKTLPSHASMLTGVAPEVHGITWNSLASEGAAYVEVPTVFDLAHAAGMSTAAFASKAKFRHLMRPHDLGYAQAPGSNAVRWMATRTIQDVQHHLRHHRPNLLFVHLGEPDYAGHTAGWMSGLYGWAVGRADAGLARILESADAAFGAGAYTVIVTADHGGHARTHGTAEPDDRVIPWLVWGRGVNPGSALLPGIRTMDTAATALWLLGLEAPTDWAGRPVLSAFSAWTTPPAATAAR